MNTTRTRHYRGMIIWIHCILVAKVFFKKMSLCENWPESVTKSCLNYNEACISYITYHLPLRS